ncbi:hypothetical protein BU23DRAFT_658946 [Bimuria novae-zelandiae CBS 107.79]|uniref:Fucose-specific lectin n=1 Tax=Bimuria novae-zelandiae CBS 107.79 TaxID=1447943 RepID=A0A6A5URF3_9PLEO|nr:hypothetical protein BU23DRAFT_658946 [Bimuria novae-zelandiae CBS 107.79]
MASIKLSISTKSTASVRENSGSEEHFFYYNDKNELSFSTLRPGSSPSSPQVIKVDRKSILGKWGCANHLGAVFKSPRDQFAIYYIDSDTGKLRELVGALDGLFVGGLDSQTDFFPTPEGGFTVSSSGKENDPSVIFFDSKKNGAMTETRFDPSKSKWISTVLAP